MRITCIHITLRCSKLIRAETSECKFCKCSRYDHLSGNISLTPCNISL